MRSALPLALFLLVLILFPNLARTSDPLPATSDSHIQVWVFKGLQWISKGRLLLERGDSEKRDHYEVFVYQTPSRGIGLVLNGSISALETLVRTEQPVFDKAFVESELPELVVMAFAPANSSVVQPKFLAEYERNSTDEAVPTIRELSKPKYRSSSVLGRQTWTLEFCVLNSDGSLVRFALDGQVSPFAVSSLTMTKLAPAGTYMPLIMIR